MTFFNKFVILQSTSALDLVNPLEFQSSPPALGTKTLRGRFIRYFPFSLCLSLCLCLVGAPEALPVGFYQQETPAVVITGVSSMSGEDVRDMKMRLADGKEVIISLERKTGSKAEDDEAQEEPAAAAEPPAEEEFEEELEFEEGFEDPFAAETPEYPPIEDPLEKYNRMMFNFNDKVFVYFFEPLAKGYKKVVHEEIRLSIKNVFANALSPVKLFSSILQGDVDKSVRVFGRLIINTTVGLGGLFDVAKYYEIDSVNEDFSQALGYHGVPTGPYLVLPILGPSSGRGAVGQVVDMFLNPLVFISPSFLVGSGITIGRNVNDTSFTMDGYNDLKESAVDPYVSMRDFTHQYREGLIRE